MKAKRIPPEPPLPGLPANDNTSSLILDLWRAMPAPERAALLAEPGTGAECRDR
jgi:hypothetical protein